jgi:hypothetical protein
MKREFFPTGFRKTFKYQISLNIRPVGAALFRADGWTDGQRDLTKLIVAFRTFANAPKNCLEKPMPCG